MTTDTSLIANWGMPNRILVGPDAWGIEAINRLLGSAYQPLVERFSRKNLYI